MSCCIEASLQLQLEALLARRHNIDGFPSLFTALLHHPAPSRAHLFQTLVSSSRVLGPPPTLCGTP